MKKLSKIKSLVSKSKLELVSCAYSDLLDWEDDFSDERLIEEIKWKLQCAKQDKDYLDYDPQIKKVSNFIKKLDNLLLKEV